MKSKKLISALSAAGLGLALSCGSASAVIQFFSPITAFQDDNIDFVVDSGAGNPGVLGVGDRLVSVFELFNTQGVLAGQGPTNIAPEEVTGVADVTIVAVVGGNYILAASGATGVLSAFAPGTAIAVWTDNAADLNVINSACGTRAQCLALAGLGGTDGSALYATFGFFGDPDAFWVATPAGGGGTISTVQNGGSSTNFGTFSYGLQIGTNNTGFAFGEQACGVFCGPGGNGLITTLGSGNILGGQFLDPAQWTARSDADFQLLLVPEPSSLALLGLALAGIGGMQLRRRNK